MLDHHASCNFFWNSCYKIANSLLGSRTPGVFVRRFGDVLWQIWLLRSDVQYLMGAQGWIYNHLCCEQQDSVTAPGWFYCSGPKCTSLAWQWWHTEWDILSLFSPFVVSSQALGWPKSRDILSTTFPFGPPNRREREKENVYVFFLVSQTSVYGKRGYEKLLRYVCGSQKWSWALFFL